MLPPVRTISGSSGSYQNSSSVTASAHLTGEPILPGQAADADRDVNPNLAGKLNVLLLSGRDIVAEDLSMLADALGKVIDLPRRPGEQSADYIHRLAEALSNLSGNLRAEVERQLNLILRGMRLQVVIEAFRNPTGPEAARIVALLETADFKGRDLATQTVLTSYRQNGGADIADMTVQGPPQVNGALPVAAAEAVMHTAIPPAGEDMSQVLGAASTISTAPPGAVRPPAAPAEAMPLFVAEEFEDEPELVIFHPETDNIFSRTSPDPARERPADRYASLASGSTAGGFSASAAVSTAQDGVTPARAPLGPIADARGLQSVLDAAFAAGESADPVIQAKAAIELLAGEDLPAPATPLSRALPRRDESLVKPFIDYTRPPPRSAREADLLPAILALKGWSEGEVLGLPLLPASLEAEAVLSAALTPHAGPEPDVPESLYHLRGRGIAANDDRHKSALAAAEQQLLRTADEAAGLGPDRRLDPAPVSTMAQPERSGTDALIAAALQLGQEVKGTPYASLPYPPSDEHEDERADRAGYRAQTGDGDEENEQEQEKQDREQDETAAQDEGTMADPDADPEEGGETGDTAFDLYQRMAGWS